MRNLLDLVECATHQYKSVMNPPGNRVVITGGEGELAQAIHAYLDEQGYRVQAPGSSELDVSDPKGVHAYFKSRELDLLICNAAITRDHPLALLKESNWDEVVQINLKGAIRCAKMAIEQMKGRGGGSIVFLSSYSAIHPPIGQAAYATSKAALLGLMREFAAEVGAENIRVNAVLPGFLETRMTDGLSKQRKHEFRQHHVLGRFNTKQKVAAFIGMLHAELIHTSGQVFQLDSRPHGY